MSLCYRLNYAPPESSLSSDKTFAVVESANLYPPDKYALQRVTFVNPQKLQAYVEELPVVNE